MRAIRRLFLSFLLLLGLPTLGAAAGDFKEGVDYRVLETPAAATGDKVEVMEAFWYGCSHCFQLESALVKWLKDKPAKAEFVRVPAVLGGGWEPLGRAYFAAKVLGVQDQLHRPLFEAIHVQNQKLATPEQIADFVATQGVDKDAFLKAYNSFAVVTEVQRAKKLMLRYQVHAVPAFIVNGKYFTDVSMAGSEDRLFEVIDYLVAKESGRS